MGKNTAYGNHRAINPNYFEQNEQEAGQVEGVFFGLRIKAFFSVVAKVEFDEKKKQADAIYEADVRSALDFYNKRAKHFYEVQQKQHEEMMNFTEK